LRLNVDDNRAKRTDLEIANAFDVLFDETPAPESNEEIQAFLAEAVYDLEILRAQGVELVNNLIASNWRFVSSDEINGAESGIDEVPVRKEWNRDQLTTAIQELSAVLALGGTQPSLAFRNLRELTDSDLATILQELEYKARSSGINLDPSQG
jgi:hypothetical protein